MTCQPAYRFTQEPIANARESTNWNVMQERKRRGSRQERVPIQISDFAMPPPEMDGDPSPPMRHRPKWLLLKVLLSLILLAAIGLAILVWKTQSEVRPYTRVFLDNIYLDGIHLSGMTWAQANEAVMQQINDKLDAWYVRLRSPAGEYKDITAQMLGISRDPTQALEQAWAIGHDTSQRNRKTIFELKAEIDAARSTRYEFTSIENFGDTTPVDDIIATLERAAYVAPQDAKVLFFDPDNSLEPFAFQHEVVGQRLNAQALRSQILHMVDRFISGEVLVQPEDILPKVTVASLKPYYALRFRAITPIDAHSTDERNNNIRLAFAKLNGRSLQNGEQLSFNQTVGNRTQKNGFFQAFEYSYGELTLGWGGGVCQASTTLYLAVVQAGLEITDHTSHSTRVTYTTMGRDATVSDTRGHEIDFRFRNNTGDAIFLAARVIADPSNKNRLLCEVRVYGKALDNTRYELETEIIETLPMPMEQEYIQDNKAKYVTYTDEERTVIEASEGYVVDTYRTMWVDGTLTNRTKIARSVYKKRAARIYVGVTPREN